MFKDYQVELVWLRLIAILAVSIELIYTDKILF